MLTLAQQEAVDRIERIAELEAEVHHLQQQQLQSHPPLLHKRRRLALDSASSPDCNEVRSDGSGSGSWQLSDDAADNEGGSGSEADSPAAEQHRCPCAPSTDTDVVALPDDRPCCTSVMHLQAS